MKNLTQYIEKYPHRTQSIFGIKFEQLNRLLEALKQIEAERQAADKSSGINPKGAGRHPKLGIDEQIYLCLFYLRHHLTFAVLGLIFEVSESTAQSIFEFWVQQLRDSLPASLWEQYLDDEVGWEIVTEILEQQRLIVDSTEQRRERPQDDQAQQQHYSGKKKQHTLKSQVVATDDGDDIVDVIAGVPGPSADINLLRQQQTRLSAAQGFLGDKAYQGAARTKTPHKKPRGRELPCEKVAENRETSAQRIFVEHLIGKIKLFRVMQERFRLRPEKYETIFLTICGLVRLRLGRIDFEHL